MKNLLILLGILAVVIPSQVAFAANFSVSPLILDIDSEARESSSHVITLTSHLDRSQRLYASVHEITLGDQSEIKTFVPASMGDRTTSVTSWIEITRGRLDVLAGEKKEVPLVVRINPNTPPGLYHAFVGFATGPNRDVAEATIQAGQGTGVVLRISVGGKQEEFLRLVSFTTDRFSFVEDKGVLTYTLENTGDVPLSPKGDVIIYDSRGQELTTIELNNDGSKVINPGEQQTYDEPLPFINRLGKNKAFLSLEYGVENKATVYDTNFYYSVPWMYLGLIMLLLATVLTVLLVVVRKGATGRLDLDEHEAVDVPLFVRNNSDHSEYEHDIDLKKKE